MNPYLDLEPEALQDQLIEVRAESSDILRRMGELSLEMQVNQEHLKLIHQALGASVMHGTWEVEPRFIPCADDPFIAQEPLATVVSIYE